MSDKNTLTLERRQTLRFLINETGWTEHTNWFVNAYGPEEDADRRYEVARWEGEYAGNVYYLNRDMASAPKQEFSIAIVNLTAEAVNAIAPLLTALDVAEARVRMLERQVTPIKDDQCPTCGNLMVDVDFNKFRCVCGEEVHRGSPIEALLKDKRLFDAAAYRFMDAACHYEDLHEEFEMYFLDQEEWDSLLKKLEFLNEEGSDPKWVLRDILSEYSNIARVRAERVRRSDVWHAMGHVFNDVIVPALLGDTERFKMPEAPVPPLKKYVDNPELSWEERYVRLNEHHQQETAWLMSEINRLRTWRTEDDS